VCRQLEVEPSLCRALLDCPVTACCDYGEPRVGRIEEECVACQCDAPKACVSYVEHVKTGLCRLVKRCANAQGTTLAADSSERDNIRCVRVRVTVKPSIDDLSTHARLWAVARGLDATASVSQLDGTSATLVVVRCCLFVCLFFAMLCTQIHITH
jgi:hypothetical protein